MSKTLECVVLFFSLVLFVGCSGDSSDVSEGDKPVFLPADADDEKQPEAQPAETTDRSSAFVVEEDALPDPDEDLGTAGIEDQDAAFEPAEELKGIEKTLQQINEARSNGDSEGAARIAAEAYEANPGDLQLRQTVISLYVEAGQFDKAIGVLEPIVEASPGDINNSFALAQIYMMSADQTAEDETAVGYMQKAGKLERALQTSGAFEQMGPRGSMILSSLLHNEAKVLAGRGDPTGGITALRDAFDAGYSDISSVEADEAFVALADSPEYQSLIQEYGEKIRARMREEARTEMAANEPFDFSFALPDLVGETVSSADSVGKVLIVDIWGTWCGPCQMEIPHFIKLHKKFADDLDIVGINYEQCEEALIRPTIEEFVKKMGISYPCVIGDEAVEQQANLEAFPTTIFLDREGKVRLKLVGLTSYEKLEAIVQELVDEEKAPA